MNIDRVLQEYAKLHLQLTVALERIAQLEAQLAAKAAPGPKDPKRDRN